MGRNSFVPPASDCTSTPTGTNSQLDDESIIEERIDREFNHMVFGKESENLEQVQQSQYPPLRELKNLPLI
jgi:hypothetical protein